MGRKATKIELSTEQRAELTKAWKESEKKVLRQRSHLILLKSEGRSSKDIAGILDMEAQAVNHWVRRFRSAGIEALHTRSGQGRKAVFDVERDSEIVRKAVQSERQQLKNAQLILEEQIGKPFSLKTLKRFLKNLSASGNASV